MAAYRLFFHRYYCRSVKCVNWWIHACVVVRVVFLVCSRHNLYGGIDDTSQPGTQETKLGREIRRIRALRLFKFRSEACNKQDNQGTGEEVA